MANINRMGIRAHEGNMIFLEALCDVQTLQDLARLQIHIVSEVLKVEYTPVHNHPDHMVFQEPVALLRHVYNTVAALIQSKTGNNEMMGRAYDCRTIGMNHSPVLLGGVYSFNFFMKDGGRYKVWFRASLGAHRQHVQAQEQINQPWWKRVWTKMTTKT